MKREYKKPAMRVVKVQQMRIICASDFSTFGTNLEDEDEIFYGGGGSQQGR